MNPIESIHHLKSDEWLPYREGVVVNRPVKNKAEGSWAEIGLKKVFICINISIIYNFFSK
jgi:hypothetical protein